MVTNLKLFIRFVVTMDNIQLILYIVFLVGYFIYKMVAGKNKPVMREDMEKYDQVPQADSYEPEHNQEYESEYDPTERPKSFEEILEELAGGGREKQLREEEARRSQEARMKAKEAKEAVVKYADEKREVYNESVRNASKYLTLDEQVNIDDIDIGIKEVEDLDAPDAAVSNEYLALFRNLDDAKKAIVMSEIINKKY